MTDTVPHPMTNTHILVQEFDYHEPASLQQAFDLLARYGENVALVAGGSGLFVSMKMERSAPRAVVSLQRIPGLNQVALEPGGGLRIGACTPIHDIRSHPRVCAAYPALAQACASFGSAQIEIMGTIGGNLCNGSPASDTVPALLVLDAVLEIRSAAGARLLPAGQFILSPGRTALQPGEILTAVILPPPPDGAQSAFYKVTRVTADLAKASLAVLLVRKGNTIEECRLAFGSVSARPMRTLQAEALLNGQAFSPELALQAGQCASLEISPIDDVRSSAWYRRQLASVMVHDTLQELWASPARGRYLGDTAPLTKAAPVQPGESRSFEAGEETIITLVVNGQERRVSVKPNDLLLNVLREKLQLTGSKYGCGLGECSACTVHLDGKPALSCLVLAAAADGRRVDTIEGLQQADGSLDPLQEAFIQEAAFQCGYCTPGIIMTLKSLLAENGAPSEDEVRDYLKGNRCRCTGYASIMRAVIASLEEPVR